MYFPKSQLTTDLYTNGDEYIIASTGEQYKGYYFKVINGTQFTGRNPQDGTPLELINTTQASTLNVTELDSFPITSLKPNSPFKSLPDRFIPTMFQTTPSSQDYSNGEFMRYFCKKTNEPKFIEINKETYDKLTNQDPEIAWDLYEPQSFIWYITPLLEFNYRKNKQQIQNIEIIEQWYGFSQYIKEDYTKYSPK